MDNIPENFGDAPRITLAGKEWAVPPLSARTIIKFGGKIMGLNLAKLDESGLKAIYEATHIVVGAVYKELTFDQFLDMPVTMDEILEAMPVMTKAAGMKMTKPGEAEGAPLLRAISSSKDGQTPSLKSSEIQE